MCLSPDNANLPESTKLKVLVVDDEPTLRLGFAYALSNRTTIVETAATGRQAMERIAVEDFDIMILDLRMPELDGLEVIQQLRSQGNRMFIVLCSAAMSPNAVLRAIRCGVVDFLLKPVRPADLRQVVEFVTRPDRQALPLALRAVREGRPAEAIRILKENQKPTPQAVCWLELLNAIQDSEARPDSNEGELEEKVRRSLPTLAFHAPPML